MSPSSPAIVRGLDDRAVSIFEVVDTVLTLSDNGWQTQGLLIRLAQCFLCSDYLSIYPVTAMFIITVDIVLIPTVDL